MRKIALLAAGILLACMQPGHATRAACDFNPAASCYETTAAPPSAHRARAGKRHHYNVKRRDKARTAARGGIVPIQCGPRTIRVARTASVQFTGFCRDFYAAFKFSNRVGGVRGGSCHTGGKHPCGGAVDIDQTCRSSGHGHCGISRDWPIALSEKLADKWGLFPGSRWGNRDVGHFETKATLAGSNWPENKLVQVALAAVTKMLPDPPQPPHPLLNYQLSSLQSEDFIGMVPHDFSPVPSVGRHAFTPLGFAVYNEYQPQRISDVAKERLRGIPIGTAREEIKRAAALFGHPDHMMMSFAKIESDFNCGLQDRKSKYRGLFQLSEFEFKRYGSGDIWNCRDHAIASAHKFAVEGAFFEHATGRWPTFAELYMIHQQGLEGATEHYARPDRLAILSMCATGEGREKGARWCRKAICLNVPSDTPQRANCDNLTSGEFTGLWKGRVDKFASLDLETETRVVERPRVKRKAHRHRHAHRKRHYRHSKLASR